MAMRVETNPLEMAYAVLLEHGLEGAGEALRILVNEAAKIERSQFLGAAPYERSERRRDYANGYKPKTVLTRLGELTFQVPQVRCGDFYPSALEKGTRTDQAVHLALAEMYVQGVSTRRVIEVLQRLLGPEISLSTAQVSRAAARLDEGLAAWRERPLGEVPYLFLDARYEKVRLEGRIVDCAVLIAVGVDATGKRRVLGCTVATSEAEINWRRFLESLLARGLHGIKLIIADDHAGLKAARKAVFPSVPFCSLAALPVPSAAKRRPVRHPTGGEKARRRDTARDLQCSGQGRSRAAFESRPGHLAQGASETGRVGRNRDS